jgi:hypothetical protein
MHGLIDLELLEAERKGLAPIPAHRKATEAARNDAAAHNPCSTAHCTTAIPSIEDHWRSKGWEPEQISKELADLARHESGENPAPEFTYFSEWENCVGVHYPCVAPEPIETIELTGVVFAASGDGFVERQTPPTVQITAGGRIHEAVTLYDFDCSVARPGDLVHVLSSGKHYRYDGDQYWTSVIVEKPPTVVASDIVAWYESEGAGGYTAIRLIGHKTGERWRLGYYPDELVVDSYGQYWRWDARIGGGVWLCTGEPDLLCKGRIIHRSAGPAARA